MSAIASAFVVQERDLAALMAAAKPQKRLLRKPLDRFPGFLASHARVLAVFTESGFLFTTVLVFLGERGIDLLQSAHAISAEELQQYHETFTETNEPGVGAAMQLAIEYLRTVLAAVPDAGFILFNIG